MAFFVTVWLVPVKAEVAKDELPVDGNIDNGPWLWREDDVENLEMTRRVCWSVCLCWCTHEITCICHWKKSTSAD
jgi:hypothetical protein